MWVPLFVHYREAITSIVQAEADVHQELDMQSFR